MSARDFHAAHILLGPNFLMGVPEMRTDVHAIDLSSIAADTLYPPPQVARLLNKSEKTLANDRCAGRGPRMTKLGGRVYYLGQNLLDYLVGTSSARTSVRP